MYTQHFERSSASASGRVLCRCENVFRRLPVLAQVADGRIARAVSQVLAPPPVAPQRDAPPAAYGRSCCPVQRQNQLQELQRRRGLCTALRRTKRCSIGCARVAHACICVSYYERLPCAESALTFGRRAGALFRHRHDPPSRADHGQWMPAGYAVSITCGVCFTRAASQVVRGHFPPGSVPLVQPKVTAAPPRS